MRWISLLLGTLVLNPVVAAAQGKWATEVFQPAYDSACGLGTDLALGCDAIRAREIVDAAAAPWRAIGRVNFANFKGRHHCTGTLVAEDVVLTAAHCIYDFEAEQLIAPQALIFVAGFQRGTSAAVSRGVRYRYDARLDWRDPALTLPPHLDWVLLTLAEPIGQVAGFLPLADGMETAQSGADPIVAGYAGLRRNVLSVAANCGSLPAVAAGLVALNCPVMRGDSGAPVLVGEGAEMRVAGVFSSLTPHQGGIIGLAVASEAFRDVLTLD